MSPYLRRTMDIVGRMPAVKFWLAVDGNHMLKLATVFLRRRIRRREDRTPAAAREPFQGGLVAEARREFAVRLEEDDLLLDGLSIRWSLRFPGDWFRA